RSGRTPITIWWWPRGPGGGTRRGECRSSRARRARVSPPACWATPICGPPSATPPSCLEKLPCRPQHQPIDRHRRDEPSAADGLLDREPSLDARRVIRHRKPEAEPALPGTRVEHAGRRRESHASRERDRVLRRLKRIVIAPLGEVARREPDREFRREAHQRRYIHSH